MNAEALAEAGREVVRVVRDEEVTFLAAAIAYYAFVSVLPALLVALAVATAVGGEALADRIVGASGSYLTPAGEGLLVEAITGSRGRAGATVVGTALLLWSTLRVFRGLDVAFSRVYGVDRSPSLPEQVRNASVVLVTVGIGIVAMVGVGGTLAAVDLPVGADVLGLVLLLAGLVLVFLPLYYVFPGVEVGAGDALPGAAFAAVSWVVLQALFQAYAAAAPGYDLYGVIGGALLLVTWFYVAAISLLVGAAVNVAVGDRQVQQAPTPDANHEHGRRRG